MLSSLSHPCQSRKATSRAKTAMGVPIRTVIFAALRDQGSSGRESLPRWPYGDVNAQPLTTRMVPPPRTNLPVQPAGP